MARNEVSIDFSAYLGYSRWWFYHMGTYEVAHCLSAGMANKSHSIFPIKTVKLFLVVATKGWPFLAVVSFGCHPPWMVPPRAVRPPNDATGPMCFISSRSHHDYCLISQYNVHSCGLFDCSVKLYCMVFCIALYDFLRERERERERSFAWINSLLSLSERVWSVGECLHR